MAAELHPLEEPGRQRRARFLEHALVETEPRQFTIDGGLRVGRRHVHRGPDGDPAHQLRR